MANNIEEISSRINFLKKNPSLAVKALNKSKNYFSNCHGTVAYILAIEEGLKRESSDNNDFLYIEGRPPCVGRDLIKIFIEKECELIKENYMFGDIVSIWSKVHRITSDMPQPKTRADMLKILDLPPVKTIEHSAILIDPEDEKIFHQQETGKKFEYNTLDKYISKWFPYSRGRGFNLFVDFYRLK